MTFEHVANVNVAGITVRIQSNSADVIAMARKRHAIAASNAKAVCSLQVQVRFGGAAAPEPMDLTWSFPDADHVRVSGRGFAGSVDLEEGIATVTADESLLRDPEFRRTVIEGVVLLLITRRDRHPIHAAAIRDGDAALLLHGPGGVGKSTIAYEAYRAGMDVLADDSTRIQLEPELRVWGDGTQARIHLLEHARADYADLSKHDLQRFANGVQKITVELPPPGARWVPFTRAVRVCLLSRNGDTALLREVGPDEIRSTLLNAPEAALDRAPQQRERVVSALAAVGGWQLNLSSRPREALPHIRAMLAEVAALS